MTQPSISMNNSFIQFFKKIVYVYIISVDPELRILGMIKKVMPPLTDVVPFLYDFIYNSLFEKYIR